MLFNLCFISVFAQTKTYRLVINPTDSNAYNFLKNNKFKHNNLDSISLINELFKLKQKAINQNYLETSVDSIVFLLNNANAYFRCGEMYVFETSIIDSSNIFPKKYLQKLSMQLNSLAEIDNAQKLILQYFENNGYPFAKVSFAKTKLGKYKINSQIVVTANQLIRFNQVVLKGQARISNGFLKNYLGIAKGNIYNESVIANIDKRIDNLSFIKKTKPCEVEFLTDKADVYLYLENKKANSFSGILGIATSEQNNTIITGELNFNFQNLFKQGEQFSFYWKRLRALSQKLDVGFKIPFLFAQPLGADVGFMLEKTDTLYLNRKFDVGGYYYFMGLNSVKFFFQNRISDVLLKDESNRFTNSKINLYGTELFYENLNYKFNPSKGFSVLLNASVGNKSDNSTENKKNYSEFHAKVSFYVPIWKRFVYKFQNQSAAIRSQNNLADNQLLRIGGWRLLRGFDEESVLVSAYSVFSSEFRYLYERNSNFFVFFDYAAFKKNEIKNKAIGFGIGINFETKAGVFTLEYAVGKQNEMQINMRSSKIHFGIVNQF